MSDSVTLTATFKNRNGTILTGLIPDGWETSNPAVVSVTLGGVVTALQDGTAIVTATYQSLRSNPCVVTVSAQQIVDTNHPNEPANMTQLSRVLDGTVAPGPTYDPSVGWVGAGITVVQDTIPGIGLTDVLQAYFPPGMIGGVAPARCWTQTDNVHQDWQVPVRTIYQSFLYRYSPNFPTNLVANKMVYTQINHSNSVVAMTHATADEGTQYTAPMHPMIGMQNILEINGDPAISMSFTNWGMITPRAQWVHFELLYRANTAGNPDGFVRMWQDNVLAIELLNVKWDRSGAAGLWNTTFWDPVYGGGGSVPLDAVNPYHHLKNFYVSGKAA